MIMRHAHGHLGEGGLQCGFDPFHYGIGIGHHVACPKSYHAKIITVKPCGAARVMSRL